MWKLAIRYGEAGEADFPLCNELTVGRSPESDIFLDDAAASRRHARFFCEGGAAFVEDCGSANGVFCNGARVEGRRQLRGGDAVLIGGHKLIVMWSDEPAAGDDTADRTIMRPSESLQTDSAPLRTTEASPRKPDQAKSSAGCLGVLTALAFGAIVLIALC